MPDKSDITPHKHMPWGARPFTFDRVVRLLITALVIALAIWLVNILKDVLLPFLVAWLLAYMAEPLVQINKRVLRMRRRLIPVFITLFECITVVTALGMILMPSIVDEMQQLSLLVKNYSESPQAISFIPPAVHDFLRSNIDFETISKHLTTADIQSIGQWLWDILSGGVGVIMSVFNWFLVLLYVVFIMLDYERLLTAFKRMVPPRYRTRVFAVTDDVKNSMNHYFRGQATVAACVGILFCIGFLIVGMPLAVLLGIFIGILNMVPYLQLISLPITTVLCLIYAMQPGVEFWPIWWQCMLVYAVVQVIQDLILTPKIMGHAMGLNPAIILLSLSVWGALLGFVGLIIALPLTTLLLSYYDRYISRTELTQQSVDNALQRPYDDELG